LPLNLGAIAPVAASHSSSHTAIYIIIGLAVLAVAGALAIHQLTPPAQQ
jgi:hypothetical protein